eukprot:gnl/Hemi2/6110_TR2112_c0_g2_i1.p2 gnl/Hemi2/6110_TR2112_c0_g2~~gnl/Hemi2/6110_TR2112_c0_g2_i1.p2  ORF type:complete len:140 (+),score=39.36 gnl/Hemi2/6110_TR2112_c0_g2_i1:591-1010(+)
MRVWDMKTKKYVRPLQGHTAKVNCLRFDGNMLLSGSADASLRIWDISTGACSRVLSGHQNGSSIMCLAFDHWRIASAGWDCVITLWDLATGERVRTLEGHAGWVWCMQLAGDVDRAGGGCIVSGSEDGSVRRWETTAVS